MPPHDFDRPTDLDAPMLDYDPDAVPVVYPVRMLWCWRCGETAEPVAGRCPWCGTWTDGEPPPPPRAKPVYELDDDEPESDWHAEEVPYAIPVRRPYFIPPFVVVIVAYVLLLGSLIGCSVVAALRGVATEDDMQWAQALTEIVSTMLTLASLAMVWSAARQRVPEGTAVLAWASSLPVLGLLLCLNIAIFTFMRELLRPLGAVEPPRMKVDLATILLICVQPAIVEELFFRQMTLGVLRKSMNTHLAVWLTGAVFAGAHLGNILGMPYLFLVGAFLGYARVYGGLTLAMVLHFLHNFVVVAYDAWR